MDIYFDFSRLDPGSGITASPGRCVFDSIRIATESSSMIVLIYSPKDDVRDFQSLHVLVRSVVSLVTVTSCAA